MNVYFDNAATTKPFDEVIEQLSKFLLDTYGNPSSLHRLGVEAERIVKEAKEIIAKKLGSSSDEIYFTSGGTEANNLALIGCAFAHQKRGKRIVSTPVEHPSVISTLEYLERNGFEIQYVPVDAEGNLDFEQFEKLVDQNTILVSVMLVNNETGHIFDVKKLSEIAKKKNPNVIVHTDAVQAFMKEKTNVKELNVDLMSISGHKIHALKGIGALYIRKGINIQPIIFGGQQQKGIRPGTENMPGIFSFAKAIEVYEKLKASEPDKLRNIKRRFIEGLSAFNDVVINSPLEKTSDAILNVSFLGIKSEIFLHTLESYGIFASSGSACSSKGRTYNKVLHCMGKRMEIAESSIRFSFSYLNQIEEVDYVLECIEKSLRFLRKIKK
ncbi:aminotransferase class V [Caldicellulosiruptor hydrothermalis 108]|uniref:Aminotransferase class V n=1 Tax=Caldicellulosiruptor hydrothermalis (strain DSM 18901 / VKM B-2411 / 108) TaxID=632292 RepID=E4Q8Z1_CALH1|nr:cysteine desulfurase family protein [Caldicellulosiruptor hydrothermalis]ADQ06910.1 aminotransferase class V [Caldicellulosiruptor hydrothermalis 108]